MKWMVKLKDRLKGLTNAISRFPRLPYFFCAPLLKMLMILVMKMTLFPKFLLAFLVGAFLSAVFQVLQDKVFLSFQCV